MPRDIVGAIGLSYLGPRMEAILVGSNEALHALTTCFGYHISVSFKKPLLYRAEQVAQVRKALKAKLPSQKIIAFGFLYRAATNTPSTPKDTNKKGA